MKLETGYSLYVYGSRSRGETRTSSDIDLLVVFSDKDGYRKSGTIDIPDSINENKNKVDISYYSLERIKKMNADGHLFAWHLFKESKHLGVGNDFLSNLGEPSNYNSFVEDTKPLLELLNSIKEELEKNTQNSIYEAGLIYLCARNIAMSASYFSPAGLTFSAYAPFMLGYKDNQFPINRDEYEKLRLARLSGTRGIEPKPLYIDILFNNVELIINWASREYHRMVDEK